MKSILMTRPPRFLLYASALLLIALQPVAAQIDNSAIAVGYIVNGGETKIALKETNVLPKAKGEAKVDAKSDVTRIEAKVENLAQPGQISTEFLTYVLWAVTPDGRTNNLGEILIDEDGNGKLKVTTQLQTFSLIVTSEPYHSVRQPSELIVLANEPQKYTKGKLFQVDHYRLMKKNQYEKIGNPLALSVDLKNVPLQMYEARNAVEIAKSRSADKYAPEIYGKAEASLKSAEELLQQDADKKDIISTARQTVQFSEDSRALAAERQDQERVAMERQAAAEGARAEAEIAAAVEAAEVKRDADQEAQRQANLATAKEARLRAQSEELRTKEVAALAEAERARIAEDALRDDLLEQLSRVLETRDTPRGLVVNMADVLFGTGKHNLNPEAREKLAKLSGILAVHAGLQLEVEGYTDSTGTLELNQTLSERRAQSVADYLIQLGVPGDSVKSRGFGSSRPIADNDTNEGRQKNRRVEIIVSGKAIGRTLESIPIATDNN
jgi:outer membrane protein OmpA-like peptidoglycan-associated protein